MKLGVFTTLLSNLPFEEALKYFTGKNLTAFEKFVKSESKNANDILISLETKRPALFNHNNTKIPKYVAKILNNLENLLETKMLIFSKDNGKTTSSLAATPENAINELEHFLNPLELKTYYQPQQVVQKGNTNNKNIITDMLSNSLTSFIGKAAL